MRFVRQLHMLLLFCTVGSTVSAHAADCNSNFTDSGNFLSGQKFKTVAELPNIQVDSAFISVQRYLATEGWAIQQADRAVGFLTAWHSGSRPERPYPLTITVEPSPGGAKLSLVFSTPAGAFTSPGTVQTEFCKVAAVALAAPAAQAAPALVTASMQPSRVPLSDVPRVSDNNTAATSAPGQLCLGKACLGMTLEESASLPLLEAGLGSDFRVSDHGDCLACGSSYGLNSKGQRIWYGIPTILDRKWIQKYIQTVKLACSVGGPTAHMKASDGQTIILSFWPAIRNGKGVMELVHINRFLPKTMSPTQWKAFEQEARERYGSAFYSDNTLYKLPPGPYVTVRSSELVISQNRQWEDVSERLKEQPGCSERTSLE